mmetsp:Transcript_24933/g.71560  ORF Transcript_24933/g.71560 Transcript_24933/m.71560 type:complete len:407 (+) Transcript_24933:162-1382(+)
MRPGRHVPAGRHRPGGGVDGKVEGVRHHLRHRRHGLRHRPRRGPLGPEVPGAASLHLADLLAVLGRRHGVHRPRSMASLPRLLARADCMRPAAHPHGPSARANAKAVGRLAEDPLHVGGAAFVRHVPHPLRDASRRQGARGVRGGGWRRWRRVQEGRHSWSCRESKVAGPGDQGQRARPHRGSAVLVRPGVAGARGEARVVAERLRRGWAGGAVPALRAAARGAEGVVGLRGLHACVLLVWHDAFDHGLLLLDHLAQHRRVGHGVVLEFGRRWLDSWCVDYLPLGRLARAWRLLSMGDWRPLRDLRRLGLDVRPHLHPDHDRRCSWRCGGHHHHARLLDLPALLGRQAVQRAGAPPGEGVRRPPLQRERLLRGPRLAPVRLPARHVLGCAPKDGGAARKGAHRSRK